MSEDPNNIVQRLPINNNRLRRNSTERMRIANVEGYNETPEDVVEREERIRTRNEGILEKRKTREDTRKAKELLLSMNETEEKNKKEKAISNKLRKTARGKRKKRAVRSHDFVKANEGRVYNKPTYVGLLRKGQPPLGRPVNKLATRVSKLRTGQFPRRKK